jgi:broad specificity phosphatase PhoE
MTVTLFRHYKVIHSRRRRYTPAGYAASLKEYDAADVVDQRVQPPGEYMRIITSTLRRTRLTLAFLYGDREHERTPLLDEVSMAPFTDRDREYDATFLDAMARIQWAFNNPRQPETRAMTVERANAFMDEYLRDDASILIIGHGFFFRVLSREMLKRGFSGKAIVDMRNGDCRTFSNHGAGARRGKRVSAASTA